MRISAPSGRSKIVTEIARIDALTEGKLSAPFSRQLAEPLDADAVGQTTFYHCFDNIWGKHPT
jgi:hypothetical protein